MRPLVEYILDGDLELRAVEAQLAQAQAKADGTREASLHAAYERLDGYTARSRAAQLAAGLGFAPAEIERPLRAVLRRPAHAREPGARAHAPLGPAAAG